MFRIFIKTIVLASVFIFFSVDAQLFRTKDRIDNLEGFDDQKFSWGFFLAGNHYDYKMVLNPKYGMSQDKNINLVESKGSASFGAGLIGKMKINQNFDLRIEPGLQFVQRNLKFDTQNNDRFQGGTTDFPAFTPINLQNSQMNITVKSTYIDVPVLLEFHGDRWFNSRPYAAAGINYLVNLQSNQNASDDNSNGVFRSITHNFGWSAEIGIQFYFSRFKLTPAFRGTFITNNELVKDNVDTPPYWTGALTSIQSRAFMFVLKFE